LARIPKAAVGEAMNFMEMNYKRQVLRYEVKLTWPARDDIEAKMLYDHSDGHRKALFQFVIVTKQSEVLKRTTFQDSSPEKNC
jgi:hypothetical protein